VALLLGSKGKGRGQNLDGAKGSKWEEVQSPRWQISCSSTHLWEGERGEESRNLEVKGKNYAHNGYKVRARGSTGLNTSVL